LLCQEDLELKVVDRVLEASTKKNRQHFQEKSVPPDKILATPMFTNGPHETRHLWACVKWEVSTIVEQATSSVSCSALYEHGLVSPLIALNSDKCTIRAVEMGIKNLGF